jgi:hypothetical protein
MCAPAVAPVSCAPQPCPPPPPPPPKSSDFISLVNYSLPSLYHHHPTQSLACPIIVLIPAANTCGMWCDVCHGRRARVVCAAALPPVASPPPKSSDFISLVNYSSVKSVYLKNGGKVAESALDGNFFHTKARRHEGWRTWEDPCE